MLEAFFYGLILSFSLILPLGVQNIYVFNQGALQRNLLHALPSALTAAACDSILIILAILGVSISVLSIPWLKNTLFAVGGCFLLFMGFSTWKAKVSMSNDVRQPSSIKRQILYASSVSLLNPHALLDTVGVIGTSSARFLGSDKWFFAFACLLVSCAWFPALTIAGRCLQRIDAQGSWLHKINKLLPLLCGQSDAILFGS